MKTLKFLLTLLMVVLITGPILFGQCVDETHATQNFLPMYGSYETNELFTAADGSTFVLRMNDETGAMLMQIRDSQDAGNEIINSSSNNFIPPSDIPLDQQEAIDAIIVAEQGQNYFCEHFNLDLISPGTIVNINEVPDPMFGLGPYVNSGTKTLSLPWTENGIRPDVLAHEYGHIFQADNFPLLTSSADEGEGMGEGFSDIIGVCVENSIADDGDPWFIQGGSGSGIRDLSQKPDVLYDHPNFTDQTPHVEGGILGHWFFLLNSQDGCTPNITAGLDYLLESLANLNTLDVVDHLGLRKLTLEQMWDDSDACSFCYRANVNAWASLGVGLPYSDLPPVPDKVTTNTGPCSVAISWEDQGIPRYLWTLTDIDGVQVDSGCLKYSTLFTYDDLPEGIHPDGYYTVRFELTCEKEDTGMECPLADPGNESFEVRFNIDPDSAVEPILPEHVFITACDIVIQQINVGMNPEAYKFTLDGTPIDLDPVLSVEDDFIYFHLNEQSVLPFIEEGMVLGIEIDYRDLMGNCTFNFIFDDIILQETSAPDPTNMLDFQVVESPPPLVTRCFVQPALEFLNSSRPSSSDDVTTTRIAFFEGPDPVDLSFEACQSFFVPGRFTEVSTRGDKPLSGIIPDIPPGAGPNVKFLVQVSVDYRLRNPGHPNYPDVRCFENFHSDCVVVTHTLPTSTCDPNNPPFVDVSYCIEGSDLRLEFDFDPAEVSYIQYRYQIPVDIDGDPNTVDFSEPCFLVADSEAVVSLPSVELQRTEDPDGNPIECLENILVEARAVCECDFNGPDPTGCFVPNPTLGGSEIPGCSEDCNLDNWQPAIGPDNECAPVELVTYVRCGETIAINYMQAPNAYGYRVYWRRNVSSTVNEEGYYWCEDLNDCFPTNGTNNTSGDWSTFAEVIYAGDLDNDGTQFISLVELEATMGRTYDPNISYQVQISTVCCDATGEPNIEGNCRLTIDIPPDCALPTNVSADAGQTKVDITWTDNISANTTYLVKVDPTDDSSLNSCNNVPTIQEFIEVEATAGGGASTFSISLEGLIPFVDYEFRLFKNCSNEYGDFGRQFIDCEATSVTGTFKTQNVGISVVPACAGQPGQLIVDVDELYTGLYQFRVGFKLGNWEGPAGPLVFDLDPGPHLIRVNRTCTFNYGSHTIPASDCQLLVPNNLDLCPLFANPDGTDCGLLQNIEWYDADGNNVSNGDEFSPSADGDYYYIATTGIGCQLESPIFTTDCLFSCDEIDCVLLAPDDLTTCPIYVNPDGVECESLSNIIWWNANSGAQEGTGSSFTPALDGTFFYTAETADGCPLTSSTFDTNCSPSPGGCGSCVFSIDTDISNLSSYWIQEAINQGGLGQMTNPPSSHWPQHFEFQGVDVCISGGQELLINQDMGFSNCDVFSDVQITVGSSGGRNALRSILTSFSPCDNAEWPGINTGDGFAGMFFGTTINDATTGVTTTADGRLISTDVTYNNCGIGIDYSSEVHWGMFRNTFNSSNIGIFVNGGNFSYPVNHAGQWRANAQDDSNFNDINNIGIMLQGESAQVSGVNITGNNGFQGIQVSNQNAEFVGMNINVTDFEFGIVDASSISFTLSESEIMTSAIAGISKVGNSDFTLNNVDFTNATRPITFIQPGTVSSVFIEGSDFMGCTGFGQSGLVIIQSADNVTLIGNVVDDFATGLMAFDIDLSNNIIASGNSISLDDDQTGIFVSGGSVSDFRDNVFVGTNASVGVRFDGHGDNALCNNNFTGHASGIILNNSAQGQLIVNAFTNNLFGVNIFQSPLGLQDHNGNCWDGSGANTDIETTSIFTVDLQNNPQGCQLVPNGASPVWFDTSNPGNTKTDCSSLPPLFGEDDDDNDNDLLCEGGYPPPCCSLEIPPDCDWFLENFGSPDPDDPGAVAAWFLEVTTWYNAYNEVAGWPSGPDVSDCIQNVIDDEDEDEGGEGDGEEDGDGGNRPTTENFLQALEAQSEVLLMLNSATRYTSAQETKVEKFIGKVQKRRDLLQLYELPQHESTFIRYNEIMKLFYDKIEVVNQEYINDQQEIATHVMETASSLPAPYPFMETQNNVLRLRAKNLLVDATFTEADWQDLIAAANSCAYEIGQAAYYARSIYYLKGEGPHPITYQDNCQDLDLRARKTNLTEKVFRLFPNPASQELMLSYNGPTFVEKIEIYNTLGEKIRTIKNLDFSQDLKINIRELASGTYLMKIKTAEETTEQIMKFIKIE